MFHGSRDGAVLPTVIVLFARTGSVTVCTQNVLFASRSTHWWTIDWPDGSDRAEGRSGSLPTPKTSEPERVGVSESVATLRSPLPELTAPIPPAFAKAI